MKNLKRIFSLALAGTMLAGMLTVGASAAAFTDAEDIQHDEAVNVLVSLNVINGQDDGSFNPTGNVTRAQMAKMIAVTMNGGNDANTGTKTNPSFTDIKGHWAESYIEYCYDLGIISGRGNGIFDPEGKVTGLEATKMVLTAMGFDAAAYKLNGAQWAVRTDEVARTMTGQGWTVTDRAGNTTFISEPNMYEGLGNVVMAQNATRDTAAQLIWNGLQNRTRTVQPTTTGDGGVEWTYITNGTTLLNQRFNANVTTDTFVGNYYTGDCATKGEIQVGTYKFPSDFDIANIGEEVKVIWKDGARGTKGQLDSKDVIYGVFNTGASQVVTGTLADVKNCKNGKAQINIDGTNYDLNANYATNGNPLSNDIAVTVIVNYANQVTRTGDVLTANGAKTYATTNVISTADNAATTTDESDNSQLTKDLKKSTGDVIKAIIDPDDNTIHTIYVTTTKLAAVTAINSTKITMNNNVGAITVADNDVEDGLKKGDVVTVSTLYKARATDDDAYTIVKKAETVEGEVNGYKDKETVTVDSTKYNVYDGATFGLTSIPDENNIINSFDGSLNSYIGEDVVLYMVNGYVGAAIQTSKSANNYSLVTEVKNVAQAGSVFGALQLQVMDATGTKTIITVSEDSPAGDATSDYAVGDIVTYTVSGNEAEVTKEAAYVNTATGSYNDSTKTFNTVVTSSDCVLFVQTENVAVGDSVLMVSGAKYQAYNIRDLKTLSNQNSKTGATSVVKDGKVVAAFVNYAGDKTPPGATSSTVYGIISNVGGRVKDYFTYTVKSNGETYTVNSKDGSNILKKGMLVSFAQTSDDNYAAGEVTPITAGANAKVVYTKEADGNDALTFFGAVTQKDGRYVGVDQATLAMDDDVAIVYVDTKNDDSVAEGSIGAFDEVTGYANAVILTEQQNGVNVIIAVFVETSNEEDILSGKLSASADSIKDMADGMYTPIDRNFLNDASGNAQGTLNAAADLSKVRIFKFTADDVAKTYTLTVKSGNNEFYKEATASTLDDEEGHFFYVAFGDHAHVGGKDTETTNWTTGALPTGSYTWEIVASWNDGEAKTETVVSGSFSI